MNLFETIIGTRPIYVDGEITLYGVPRSIPKPVLQPTDKLNSEVWSKYLTKVNQYNPSVLASRVYGLDMSLKEFAKDGGVI